MVQSNHGILTYKNLNPLLHKANILASKHNDYTDFRVKRVNFLYIQRQKPKFSQMTRELPDKDVLFGMHKHLCIAC